MTQAIIRIFTTGLPRNLKRAAALAAVTVAAMTGCSQDSGPADDAATVEQPVASDLSGQAPELTLEAIIAARSEEARARDKWRHPRETLEFFGLQPDHFVVEMMPGDAMWYTDVIAPYVAERGRFGAIAYPTSMYLAFLTNPSEERVARIHSWRDRFPGELTAKVDLAQPPLAFEYGDIPQDVIGQVDMVLMLRELHNYNRVSEENTYLQDTLKDTFDMLKPGGVVGVVQHRAPEEAEGPDGDGSYGYMKQSQVIEVFQAAGFMLEESSEINANPNDNPETEARSEGVVGIVWRLPPTYYYGEKDRAIFEAVGETDRMTLRFRKPAE